MKTQWMTKHVCVSLGALISILFTIEAFSAPVRPTDDTLVIATVPQSSIGAASPLRTAQAALARDPNNVALAVAAARIGIEEGRTQADPRFYGQAQAALAPWWTDADAPEGIRVLRAVIQQAFHDFSAAESDLNAILQQSPGNAQARLSRAFVRMVTGNPSGASEDCANLPRRIEPIIAQICGARVEALTGSANKAYARLERAFAGTPPAQPSMHKFAMVVLADLAVALGRTAEADRLYAEAAAMGTPEASILAAYADLLLDLGRPADALKLLDGKGEADILILRRAIAAKRLNDPRLESWSAILAERFAAAEAGGVRVHLREEARFRLEVLGEARDALELARANWQVQKEPIDARLLIECAITAGQPDAAKDVIDFVTRTGIIDARIAQSLIRLKE
jgi:thioredoxin-like negative regulator of GroEL